MEDLTRRGRRVDVLNLASRKAEEAALRRYQATHWLHCLVGPLGIPGQPSEKEFISCLRNGLILCNLLNKIQPGSVPKIIENYSAALSLPWDSQPLPAYQYFENIRNFLVAVHELKLPVFDASVFERDNLEEGSSAKVVDCILALKDYHEWKQMTGGSGLYKPPRSPLVTGRVHVRTPGMVTYDSSRQLEMSGGNDKPKLSDNENRNFEDKLVEALVEHMVDSKENMDNNLLDSFRSGNVDSVRLLSNILSSCLDEQLQKTFPKFKSGLLDHLRERSCSKHSAVVPLTNLSNLENRKCCRACLKKGNCSHWKLIKQQEKELLNVKLLFSSAKQEFEGLQSQLQNDLKQLGDQVIEMSTAALAYHKVVKENRNLYNTVQDLKGNVRVYCRIRPVFRADEQNIIDFIGEDGSLVVLDPLKPHRDGKKQFQFNKVFGPTSTQDEVYRDTQPLIKSVMDGYNVCILAYGQTGSGKTHTMCGLSGGSARELGISYLALSDLFELFEKRKDLIKYKIQVQMVEIYNEQVRDLLVEDSVTTKLDIRSCVRDNGLVLPDATLHTVNSTTDVIHLMKLGEENRAVSSTAINIRSSRSHSILTVHVHGKDASGSILHSCLHLVDLAGSERVDKSEVTGDALKEAQYINKSLSCLGDVITALAQKSSFIPYRNSKLTLLLQNSLGGNAKTLMFAHVNPEGDSFGETVSTLKFAQRVSNVELGAACANKERSEVLELKAQIEDLKKALASKEVRTPQTTKTKESAKTPLPKQMTERTPPRTRRLSIENGSTMPLERSMNCDDKRVAKTPSVKPRSRRLSLEGPRNTQKDSCHIKSPEAIRESTRPEITSSQNYCQLEDGRSIAKSCRQQVDINRPLLELSPKRRGAPRSPISGLRSPVIKFDTAMKVPSFQIPKTPDLQTKSRNEVQRVLQTDHVLSSEIKTPCSTSNTRGKGSQIKKSLRSIGKLINGSEKRNQQKLTEAMTSNNGTGIKHEAKSPVQSNQRTLRRQSLTGIHPPERSRRTSLGGVSTDSYGNENRSAKTPPPQLGNSSKSTKRWL